MTKCDNVTCPGHFTKFSNCVDEALWQLSTAPGGRDRVTGSVEAYGHYTAVTLDEPETVTIEMGVQVLVPAGHYLVAENDQGFVNVMSFDDQGELNGVFDAADARYGEWLEINEPG